MSLVRPQSPPGRVAAVRLQGPAVADSPTWPHGEVPFDRSAETVR